MNFFKWLFSPQPSAPIPPPAVPPSDIPPTSGITTLSDRPGDTAGLIFDPALRHYNRAFRLADPVLPVEDMARWHAARRTVHSHLLQVIGATKWADHLVLRGSLALKAMIPEKAREPGDIDWIVQPANLRLDQSDAKTMLDDIIKALRTQAKRGDIQIHVENITRTDIWTYERSPGHRMGIPWSCGSLPPAVAQMDFAFEQKLIEPAIPLKLENPDEPPVTVIAASPGESLAWKVMWLMEDMLPQGKDLYDAVILAETFPLSSDTLKGVLYPAHTTKFMRWNRNKPLLQDEPDWENFLRECPWVEGECATWIHRLETALATTISKLVAEASGD